MTVVAIMTGTPRASFAIMSFNSHPANTTGTVAITTGHSSEPSPSRPGNRLANQLASVARKYQTTAHSVPACTLTSKSMP